jgi:anion-transporting  ArsA/GET3 family ATPase
MMSSLLERKLIVVTGKGGTGKTTVACALGLLAARGGLRTIVVELGDRHRLPVLFMGAEPRGRSPLRDHTHPGPELPDAGVEIELEPNLWSISIDPDRALLEWLRTFAGRLSARMLAASSTFHYFAAAAPGAKELVSMVKVRRLLEGQNSLDGVRTAYDFVVLDAPATGHALAMLSSPRTFATIVRSGPLAEQAQGVRELLGDRSRSAYVAVAEGTEMAVTETLELEEGLRRQLDRDLDTVVVNRALPRRFTREEIGRIDGLGPDGLGDDSDVLGRALRMAHVTYERTRLQRSQIARLRRQRFAEGMPPSVITVPFLFTADLDLAAIRKISAGLERKL